MTSDIFGELLEKNKQLEEQFIKATDSAMQLLEIDKEHQRINGELREENKRLKDILKEVYDKTEKFVYTYAFTKKDKEDINNMVEEVIQIWTTLQKIEKDSGKN